MPRSRRIVHIITTLNDGGAEAALYRLCATLDDDDCYVISLQGPGKYGVMLEEAGISVICLNMPSGKVTFKGLHSLWRALRHISPNIIQTWMYHADLIGGIIGRFAGIRNIYWGIHNSQLKPSENKRSTILVAKICARLSRFIPVGIICCAQKSYDAHRQMGYDATKMVVIPNGYNSEIFSVDFSKRESLRSQLSIGDHTLIGLVARFDPAKDHKNLLEALSLLKGKDICPTCILVGGGMDEANAELSGLIAKFDLNDNVILLGRRTDIPAIMNALDIHVLSSSSEAFPNVLAEAMACGTPCISTDVGDASEIIGDTGWLVPPADPRALSGAIETAVRLVYSAEWSHRKLAARKRILERFSLEKMHDRYQEAWR